MIHTRIDPLPVLLTARHSRGAHVKPAKSCWTAISPNKLSLLPLRYMLVLRPGFRHVRHRNSWLGIDSDDQAGQKEEDSDVLQLHGAYK